MKEDEGRTIDRALQSIAGGEPSDAASWEAAITYFQRLAIKTAHLSCRPLHAEEARETALDFIVDPDGLSGRLSARDARNRFISWLRQRWETTIRTEPLAEDRASDTGESLIIPLSPAVLERRQRMREALADRVDANPAMVWLRAEGGEVHWVLYEVLRAGIAERRDADEIFFHLLRVLAMKDGMFTAYHLRVPSMKEIIAAWSRHVLETDGWKQKVLAFVIAGLTPKRAERLAAKTRRAAGADAAARREEARTRAVRTAEPRAWAFTEERLALNRKTMKDRAEALLQSIGSGKDGKPPKKTTGATQRVAFSQEPSPSLGSRPGGARRGGRGLPRKNEKNRGKREAYRVRGEK